MKNIIYFSSLAPVERVSFIEVGNYGLNPSDYFSFVKARWLQITGVIK
jgi:hypothetical protein